MELLLAETPAPPVAVAAPPSSQLPWITAGVLAAALGVALWAPWRVEKPAERPLARLDVDLGEDVSLPAPGSSGSAVAISPDRQTEVLPAMPGRSQSRSPAAPHRFPGVLRPADRPGSATMSPMWDRDHDPDRSLTSLSWADFHGHLMKLLGGKPPVLLALLIRQGALSVCPPQRPATLAAMATRSFPSDSPDRQSSKRRHLPPHPPSHGPASRPASSPRRNPRTAAEQNPLKHRAHAAV